MKAIVFRTYGSADVLQYEDVATPSPGDDEVLIRVRAASANPMDYGFMSGIYLMRPFTGIRRPTKPTIPGADMAGEVEAVGKNVTRFRRGDHVFGAARGAFAEYVCARENKLAPKPATISFDQAASLPVAGLTALQGLRDKANVQRGQKVLINGASGGVGTFALQIAKSLGAHVTAVCRTQHADTLRSIGADDVIDYTLEDCTQSARRYDLIFDCVGHRPLADWRRVMTPNGTFAAVGVRPGGRWIGPLPYLVKLLVSSPFISQRVVFFVASIALADLTALAQLVDEHTVTPVIDRSYTLSDASKAMAHLMSGHPCGKVVVTVD